MATKRIRLGGRADFSSRTHVFLGAEGVEVDDHTGFATGRRRRVLFDEVQLVTLDRRRNKVGLIIAAAMALMMLCIVLIIPAANGGDGTSYWALIIAMALLSGPFLIYIALHLLIGVDYITVFGKRSTAQMTFAYRKARARRVYEQLCSAIAAHGGQPAASAAPADAPAAASPFGSPEAPPV